MSKKKIPAPAIATLDFPTREWSTFIFFGFQLTRVQRDYFSEKDQGVEVDTEKAIIILSGWRRDYGDILFKTQSPNSSFQEGGFIHVNGRMRE